MKKELRGMNTALRKVVEAGQATNTYEEMSRNRVELRWAQPVTPCSVARLINLAKETNSAFEILGQPKGLADEGEHAADEAAAAAPTGVADDAREVPVQAPAAAPVEAPDAATAKKRRVTCKKAGLVVRISFPCGCARRARDR